MSVGKYDVCRAPMSEHDGLQLRHELTELIPSTEREVVLKGMRERALNYLVGSALAGTYSPDEARQLASMGTQHVLRHQDALIAGRGNEPIAEL